MGKENLENKAEGYVAKGLAINYRREYGEVIDLGLAANPSGAAFESSRLSEITSTAQLAEYDENVHHTDIKTLLLEGIGIEGVTHESVILHPNGSYGAGDEVVRALSHFSMEHHRKLTLFTPSYSFPNVQQYTFRHGVNYEPLPLGRTLFQSDSLASVLTMDSSKLQDNVVYVDYPNNPSGIADPNLLRSVVKHVSDMGGVPFVDLAFGEVLGGEFKQAINYTISHGGVCVGSLTKTQGFAALRAGYIILNPELSQKLYNAQARLVFGLPAHVKNCYTLLFRNEGEGTTLAQKQAAKAIAYNRETNKVLYSALHDFGLIVAPTILETPVQILISQDKNDNLYARLACAGIKAESLNEYNDTLEKGTRGYGDRAVRMLTPRTGMLEQTIDRIKLALTFSKKYVEEKWNEKNLKTV